MREKWALKKGQKKVQNRGICQRKYVSCLFLGRNAKKCKKIHRFLCAGYMFASVTFVSLLRSRYLLI